MPILPLPQFEEDLKAYQDDLAAYEQLKPPRTVVVRYGSMKMIGEFPYSGEAKPGCGSKLVVKTFRGTEIGEMLTSTCPNSGCSKSVTRQDMLRYIENSGGRDYPFTANGAALRVATREDMEAQAAIEQSRHGLRLEARRIAERLGITAKLVDVEPILGNERLTVYYNSEERLDLRHLQQALEQHFQNRIDLRHVGARDEARLTADYERCGQYCCCKNFLKVLKPVSMRSAKVQKATLDPLKISGRCGRLMCCLRYEDQTYEDLRRRLPKRKARVGTPEGDGIVLDTQILTQLALVLLDGSDKRVAVPIEELTDPVDKVGPAPGERPEPARAGPRPPSTRRPEPAQPRSNTGRDTPRKPREDRPERSHDRPSTQRLAAEFGEVAADADIGSDATGDLGIDDIAGDDLADMATQDAPSRKRRRRKRRKGGMRPEGEGSPTAPMSDSMETSPAPPVGGPDVAPSDGSAGQRKRKRRKRRRPSGGGGASTESSGD
ncbi:MAG: hypothetical protein KF866_11120 [Phycisphaeraceae bacterium]|nr:hypothetical protein [Phycisphaeraceae bacterium]